VDALLDRYLVIPLNSPPYWPGYNGGIERAQRELAEETRLMRDQGPATDLGHGQRARLSVESLNHRRRPCLRGRTSCEVFCTGREEMGLYNKRRRREAIDTVIAMFGARLESLPRFTRRTIDAAWRHSVETWLLSEGIITIKNPNSVTHLSVKAVS
jgi:hypothetical protein